MIIRLRVHIPKAMTSQLNGLEAHVPAIAEHVRDAAPGDPWMGWAVVRLESVEGGRTSGTGEPTADVIITAVELMQEEDATLVRKLFNAVRDERLSEGTLTDPEVVGEDPADLDPAFAEDLRAAARRRHPSTAADNPDDPEGEARYAGRPLESVALPEEPTDPADAHERIGARAAAAKLAAEWSPADDVAGAS